MASFEHAEEHRNLYLKLQGAIYIHFVGVEFFRKTELMQHYQVGYERTHIHGQDPQFLIEKIMRERIYSSIFWKNKLFACNCELMVDIAADNQYIGGMYGNQQPTPFICCVLKLLQLQPEMEIIELFLKQEHEKYLTCLAAMYLRLIGTPLEIYTMLEPLLLDKRKVRRRNPNGSYDLTYIDEFVDDLLHKERVCDTILPRMTKRYVLEDLGELPARQSLLDDLLDADESEIESDGQHNDYTGVLETGINRVGTINDETVMKVDEGTIDTTPLANKKKNPSKSKVKQLFKKQSKPKKQDEVEEEEFKGGFKDVSLNYHETNILRANLGLKPLQ